MLIDLEGVSHTYPGASLPVLVDVNLALSDRRIGVIGANGSGKSTFARLLNGLIVPSTGTVMVGGLDTAAEGRALRKRVGFCFTDPDAQIVMPTVAEDVAFGLRRRRLSRPEVTTLVDEVLERFGLAKLGDHPAHLLSGGQKQLLALAAVLITEPELVVMDEPTTLLDLRNTQMFAGLVAELPQQVVLVTHDLDVLADFGQVLVFDGSRLVHSGAPADAIDFYRRLMS